MNPGGSSSSELQHKKFFFGVGFSFGTNEGEDVSFIISDNREGANCVGKELVAAMKEKGMADGTVGLVTISLARNNGQKRTAGFRAALEDGGIKECALYNRDNRVIGVLQCNAPNSKRQGGSFRNLLEMSFDLVFISVKKFPVNNVQRNSPPVSCLCVQLELDQTEPVVSYACFELRSI